MGEFDVRGNVEAATPLDRLRAGNARFLGTMADVLDPGAAATAQAADQVTLSWTASTDNVGVTGYLIYRGGTLVGLVSGSVTSFLDRTTAPVVAYSYTVAAIDAAGNTSAQSSAANVTTPATGPTVVATDRYSRTVSNGWGTADAGGTWSNTDSTFSVNGTQGLITLTGSATKNAYLTSTSGSNTELLVRVRVDQIASGSATTDGFYLRRQSTSTWYRVAALFNTNSSIGVNFVRDSGGTTTTIGSATVSGLTHSTSTWYWIRARLSGTTATTAQIRLWADGTNEPTSWTLSSTDSSTPSSLRGSGSTGVYFAAGRALHGYYDDLTLRPIDSTAPTTPTALSGTPVAAGRIDLSWTASTDTVGVAGYNVYRDTTKINTAPVGSTGYSDTGLAAGANHTYTISALDAAGNESAQSNTYTGAAASGALTTTYSYDAENRLTQLQTGSTVLGTYAYDGAGDRIGKTVGAATTAYTLDLASSLPQVLSETTGSATTTYAYGAGGPLEIDQSGTTYWYLTDTLGSVRLLTDSTGATPATYAYSAFGSTRASTGTIANEVRFTGERTDTESGLEFLRARTYDPATGTFLQRDSWGITPTSSQSIDAYLYTANNPANATDPSGHRTLRDDQWYGEPASGSGVVGNSRVHSDDTRGDCTDTQAAVHAWLKQQGQPGGLVKWDTYWNSMNAEAQRQYDIKYGRLALQALLMDPTEAALHPLLLQIARTYAAQKWISYSTAGVCSVMPKEAYLLGASDFFSLPQWGSAKDQAPGDEQQFYTAYLYAWSGGDDRFGGRETQAGQYHPAVNPGDVNAPISPEGLHNPNGFWDQAQTIVDYGTQVDGYQANPDDATRHDFVMWALTSPDPTNRYFRP